MRPSGMRSMCGGDGRTCLAPLSKADAPAPAPRRKSGTAFENVIGSSFLAELVERRSDLRNKRSEVGDQVRTTEQRHVEPVDVRPGGHVEAYTLEDRSHAEQVGEGRAGDGHLVRGSAHVG